MKGYALHIGINYCNPGDAADCQLDGAIPDALALRDATDALGFKRLNGDGTLLEQSATEAGILSAIRSAAAKVESGDLLLITFSGLGVTPDLSDELEILRGERGWVTYDDNVIEVDAARDALSGAAGGARVLMVSACCFVGSHLGTNEAATRVGSARFVRTVQRRSFARAQARAAAGPSIAMARSRRDGTAIVYHLAASGLDEIIPDGTATMRSPFVAKLIQLLSGPPQPFPALELALKTSDLDPAPQLEKFPADSAFDAAGPFLAQPVPVTRIA